MKPVNIFLAACLAVSLAAGPGRCAGEEGADGSKGRLLLLFGGEQYHHWQENALALREVLETSGFTVVMNEDPWIFTTGGMKDYDGIVLQFIMTERWPLEVERAFLSLVSSGMGIGIVHSADNSFPGWDEFEEMVGLLWRTEKGHEPVAGHDHYGPFTVKIADKEHFITRGLGDFEVTDELYRDLTEYSDYRVLAEAFSNDKQRSYPMIMVKTYGLGRVFHTVLGHDGNSIRCPGFRQTIERGLVWAIRKDE
ncbi:MAG: ThuA domain-containing protein [Candidatus Glassbacteria bacterium]|nr:ThuA domain-containing protein [Candidatus Glassbacteria bacterium]